MRRILALASLAAISAFGVPAAEASHPTQMCLDIESEHTYDTTNDDVLWMLTAFPGVTDAGHPPEHQGCVTGATESGQDWGGTRIDFEITGDQDPDASDTPETPDATCTVPAGGNGCSLQPRPSGHGTQAFRGWMDLDLNQATVEADLEEGPDETSDPGAAEPDATDVVLWSWNTMNTTSESTITIHDDEGRTFLFGRVRSEYEPCSEDRMVKVFKQRRDGSRRLLGTTHTSAEGRWDFPAGVRGRFYAVAPATTRHTASPSTDVTCFKARSSTIRIR